MAHRHINTMRMPGFISPNLQDKGNPWNQSAIIVQLANFKQPPLPLCIECTKYLPADARAEGLGNLPK